MQSDQFTLMVISDVLTRIKSNNFHSSDSAMKAKVVSDGIKIRTCWPMTAISEPKCAPTLINNDFILQKVNTPIHF